MKLALWPLGLIPILSACSEKSFENMAGADTAMMEDGERSGGYDEAPEASDEDDLGSEVEEELLALMPATTPSYVFVANPDRDTVTRITVPSLEVITTTVGNRPVQVEVTPDHQTAVTFNLDSDNVSVIDAETLAVDEVEVRAGRNTMVMSPDGQWLVCYYNLKAEELGANTGGAQSYNDISLVNIETLQHWPMVVGPNPHEVKFSLDSAVAVVVSDSYLSKIDLTAEDPEPVHIQISDDLVDPPLAEEVALSPAGNTAIVRQFGAEDLVYVDLESLEHSPLAVGDNPTDLDITPDGSQVVAVARGAGELWIYDLADPFTDQTVIALPTETTLGSVLLSPDDSMGLVYSTASGDSLYASWNRETDEIILRDLVKPVAGVGVSPDGGTALISHDRNNGSDVSSSSPYYNKPALTMVDLDSFFSTALDLPSEPTEFAHTPDGETGFFVMEGEPYLEVLDFDTMIHDEITLKSNPVHLGTLLDTHTAFISQEHALGRISFFDPEDNELQTITGFELNAAIEH